VRYKFNKIKNKKDGRLKPDEKQIYLDGNHEDFETVKNKYVWLADNTRYPNTKKNYDGGRVDGHWSGLIGGITSFLKEEKITSALDIGCGRGAFCNILTDYCSTVHGLDFAIKPDEEYCKKGIDFIKSDAHTIPLSDKSVELVTSFDFLEHIHPDYLEKTIKEMFRVGSKYMIHKIASGPSKGFHEQVGQLHLIQEHRQQFWVNEVFKPHAKKVKNLCRVPGFEQNYSTILIEI
tara:strand:- start:1038 stop:1739 length:702 start_codon:yes stop_codon:yes gene_type:complete